MSESDTVTVVLTITKKDYAAAVRSMMNQTTARLLKILFCVSLAVLVYFAYECARNWTVSNSVGLLWGFGVGLSAAYFIFFLPLVAASEFVRKNPEQLGPTNQTLTPSGVFSENARGQATLGWNAYQRVQETRDLFLFYPQSNFAIIVPKRCFSTPDDVDKYREIIKRYCQGKVELKS